MPVLSGNVLAVYFWLVSCTAENLSSNLLTSHAGECTKKKKVLEGKRSCIVL